MRMSFAHKGALALCALLLLALAAGAQGKKGESQLRTVFGSAVDPDDNPVASSVVYLKNLKTQIVQTRFADDNGRYRFGGLDPNVDYEIHAESKDRTSSTHTISSFDTRREIEITLKLSRKK